MEVKIVNARALNNAAGLGRLRFILTSCQIVLRQCLGDDLTRRRRETVRQVLRWIHRRNCGSA